jgi:flavin-binding protein dodecin
LIGRTNSSSTAPSDEAIQRADDNFHRLQAELVGGVVTKAEITAASSNVEALEKEAGPNDE